MNDNNFHISSNSIHGLGSGLIGNKGFIENNLALVRHSGRWTLIDITKEKIPLEEMVIKGKELGSLMKAIANNEIQTPPGLGAKEFKDLTNSRFRNLCRLVPGIESPEHIATRTKSNQALRRTAETAKILGKGLNTIENGRYVGQDQGDQPYWIRETLYRDSSISSVEIDILLNGWQQDKTTHLSLKEWISAKEKGRPPTETRQEFLRSISQEAWNAEQKEAWQESNPGKSFNEPDFAAWQQTQHDPTLGLPVWQLKKISGKDNDTDYQIWRDQLIKDREEDLKKCKEKTGLDNLSFEDFERMECEQGRSGSIDSTERYILLQTWEKTKSKGDTLDDFPTFVQRNKWEHEIKTGKTQESFEIWESTQEELLHNRHEGSHLPLSFDAWRSQQDDSVLVGPAPFILLGKEERKIYETICENGILMRNGYLFNTDFEKTLHSGNGYAIFVIGSNKDLYCGSHIGGVFHHSSFLADGAVAAAGEIKTNSNGTIAELSSKSGHYRPTDAQNLYMLRYFQDRGLDLSKIKFTSYNDTGGTKEQNALEYFQELDHLENLGKIDLEIFKS